MLVVDWGTTNLRAYLCGDDGTILKRLDDSRGIKSICRDDYPVVLQDILARLDAHGQPVFISGMAGSRNGWQEVCYCQTPVSITRLAAALQPLPHPFEGFLVPGVRTTAPDGTTDVMRGEEVQVFGALDRLELNDALLCLPGTHSKWVQVKESRVNSLMTFMTGDVFQALGQTILACRKDAEFDSRAFYKGLDTTQDIDGGLLHQLFMARTWMLDDTLSEESVSSFVSGLLLGHELQNVTDVLPRGRKVIVIGSDHLVERYRLALQYRSMEVAVLGSDVATCTGIAMLRQHL
jgi:2-dehydro-3-deoxygalactonokinase